VIPQVIGDDEHRVKAHPLLDLFFFVALGAFFRVGIFCM
jgi:hypothetical protein